jgi:hypothetical protein
VTQACLPGRKLEPALVGKRIDELHEAAVRWIQQREAIGKPVAEPAETNESATTEETTAPCPTAAETAADLGPWRAKVDLQSLVEPLATLTNIYGDSKEFSGWISSRKHLAAALREEMLQQRVAGRLIPRRTVERMLQSLDTAFRLILTDAPRSIATRIAPTTMVSTAAIIRDNLEQILKTAREQMLDCLSTDDVMAPLTEATPLEEVDEVAAE